MTPDERIQRLAAFPRTNPNPVLEFSADGTLTYCNDAARHLASSLGNDSALALVPSNIHKIITESLLTGENRTNLHTVVEGHTISWSFIPLVENKIVHCYANDITERLGLEAQLRHSVKMEAVGQLAAGVAHDFNNILTVIQGHADLMLQSSQSRESNEKSIRQIGEAAERASKLIKQLLMFSRKQVMQTRNISLNEIISNLTPVLRGLLGEHINFQFIAGQHLPALYADVGMIEQVLLNLCLNARDAMRNGGRFTIRTAEQILEPVASVLNPEARPGRFICLTATDTGCGMDKSTLSHLFEPFFTTKETGKGTGLGLATIYGIIQQHQGWIVVDSELGKGSTFTFFLPGGDQTVEAPATPAPRPAQAIPQLAKGDEVILVVEDEVPLRELVVNILEICGYKIYQATTGVEALQIWSEQKGKVDLLLTDMVMPGGISGRQLAERLQADDPELKVIYTSGYSPGMAGKDIALLEGCNFLAKPYPPSRLAQFVRECLDGAQPPSRLK
ncbi:MAG TPA: ATP-binding protein [Verrucomicrobiae bacterium]|jgi:signal transduction histidine kinase|nr:ATP-binding protein [Verrucomicrobiae bacterium]